MLSRIPRNDMPPRKVTAKACRRVRGARMLSRCCLSVKGCPREVRESMAPATRKCPTYRFATRRTDILFTLALASVHGPRILRAGSPSFRWSRACRSKRGICRASRGRAVISSAWKNSAARNCWSSSTRPSSSSMSSSASAKKRNNLKGKVVVNLFFEPSTRTRDQLRPRRPPARRRRARLHLVRLQPQQGRDVHRHRQEHRGDGHRRRRRPPLLVRRTAPAGPAPAMQRRQRRRRRPRAPDAGPARHLHHPPASRAASRG